MESKERSKNHQVLWATLITLIIGIFGFAQVYIMFTLKQMDNRITRLGDRVSRLDDGINERLTQIDARLEKLNQNYIARLEHHLSDNLSDN